MAFIAPDILSPSSGSPVDGGVKASWTRSSFQFRRRSEKFFRCAPRCSEREGRADTRETDNTRSSNKSQNKPEVDESRGRDRSSVRTDRSDAPSAKETKRDRSDDDTNKSAEASREDAASSPVADGSRSDASTVGSQSVSAVTPLPNATQTSDQEQVQTEGNADSSGGEHQTTTVSSFLHRYCPKPRPLLRRLSTLTPDTSPAADKTVQSKNQPEQVSTTPAIHPEARCSNKRGREA